MCEVRLRTFLDNPTPLIMLSESPNPDFQSQIPLRPTPGREPAFLFSACTDQQLHGIHVMCEAGIEGFSSGRRGRQRGMASSDPSSQGTNPENIRMTPQTPRLAPDSHSWHLSHPRRHRPARGEF